jgi:polyisoprenoid-binding protein YceI
MIAHVKGTFKTFDASIYTTGTDFTTADIDLWIDVASISTGDETRDDHLRSADFFDVEKFKQINFTSYSIEKCDDYENHDFWGDFIMKGITKRVKLNLEFGGIAKDPWGNEKAGFIISGTINRNDWGLVWNSPLEAGGILVGDEVAITCEFELLNLGKMDLSMSLQN